MPRWFHRLVLRARIWRLAHQVEAWKSRIDDALIDQWAALESMDASAYAATATRHLLLKHALRQLTLQHAETVRQLERL